MECKYEAVDICPWMSLVYKETKALRCCAVLRSRNMYELIRIKSVWDTQQQRVESLQRINTMF